MLRSGPKFDVTYRFLTDENNKTTRRLEIVNPDGAPVGLGLIGYVSEAVMPTALLINAVGKLLYIDMTENYRVYI